MGTRLHISVSAPVDLHALAQFCGRSMENIAPGLGSTVTTPLIIEFMKRGHEVTVFTLSTNLGKEEEYQWGNLRVFVGPSRSRHLARNYYRPEIAYLKRVITAVAPPFVHAHWTYEFALGPLRAAVPTLITIHDRPWSVLRFYLDPYRAVRLLMAYEVAVRGKSFTAVSEDAASHFRQFLKPRATIEVIPNGLANEIFEKCRRPSRGENGTFTFATILQGWSAMKNGSAALRAFEIVREQIPNARLTMFGFGFEPGGPAQRWAAQRGIEGGVLFAGPQSHSDLMRRVAEEVDVVVHPSLNEAFSTTALECMALEKPLIAGRDTPGMREMLAHGTAGVLTNMRAPDEIARAMMRVAKDRDYRGRIAAAGLERSKKLYRLETVVGQYEDRYRLLLRG